MSSVNTIEAQAVITAHSTVEAHPWAEQVDANIVEREKERFHLYTLDELARLRPPSWLIDDVLPDRGVSIIYGAPGSGKSFLALDWALSIASGRDWHSRRVEPTNVVYVAAEGAYGYPMRIGAWHEANKVDSTEGVARIRFLDEPVHLGGSRREPRSGSDDVDLFVERLRNANPKIIPGLIIFDTLSRCLAGEDENSTKALSIVIENVEHLAAQFRCAVLLVHHTRRKDNEIRGSGVLAGAANMMASVRQRSSGVEVQCSKMKDSRRFDTLRFAFLSVGDSAVLATTTHDTEDVEETEKSELSENEILTLASLVDGMKRKEWRISVLSKAKELDHEIAESSIYRIINVLAEKDLVIERDDRFFRIQSEHNHTGDS
jgi:RecA-family ATPase